MSSDLGLDPSDPLNLLLHNTSQNGPGDTSMEDSSSQNEDTSPADWSQLTALWNNSNPETDTGATKSMYPDMLDYTGTSATDQFTDLSMNMDIHPFGIEPSLLHFDTMNYQQSFSEMQYPYFSSSSTDMLSSQFPFSFQAALDNTPTDSPSSSSMSSRSPSISSASPQSLSPEVRRLSVTSTSSASAIVVTPPSDSQSNAETNMGSPSNTSQLQHLSADPAEELARRVRQTAGVMLAVPMTAHFPGQASTGISMPSTSIQAKLPIPRLPRQNLQTQVKASSPGASSSYGFSSAASTPPPSTPPPPSDKSQFLTANTAASSPSSSSSSSSFPPLQTNASTLASNGVTSAGANSTSSRPKTSHTTIERRYRTNLNARIQSLRMAVPALRVLEDKNSSDGKKIKRAVKGGMTVKGVPGATGIITPGEGGTVIDVIDERGYVDGVKVARKCSKANVLGKAVEYIKVLKRREQRLRAEQAGLKTLVAGLVGGPALLREWEREWRERFGGEERDELDADELANNEADDDDSEDDEEDEEGETGRKRKRGRVASSNNSNGGGKKSDKEKSHQRNQQAAGAPGENGTTDAPIKRKRGRPRKVPLPVPAPSNLGRQQPHEQQDVNTAASSQQQSYQHMQGQSQPQQYLLGTFALFSFFNSPLTSSNSRSHQHSQHRTGVVLNPHPPLAYAPEIVAGLADAAKHQMQPPALAIAGSDYWGFSDYAQAFQLAVSVLVLFSIVMSWLGVGRGPRGRSGWISSIMRIRSKANDSVESESDKDWLKLGGRLVLKESPPGSRTMSLYTCAQVYRSAYAKSAASLEDLCTLSLVVHNAGTSFVKTLLRSRSRMIWSQAKSICSSFQGKPGKRIAMYEHLVLDSMDVDEAAARLDNIVVENLGLDTDFAPTPMKVLGGMVVRDLIKKHLGAAFVKHVEGDQERLKLGLVGDEDEQREKAFLAAAELGGRLAELARIAERICRHVSAGNGHIIGADSYFIEDLVDIDEDDEIASLVLAFILQQQVFRSHQRGEWVLPSPPPSPRHSAKDPVFLLKRTLGHRVFEEGCVDGLDDARDNIVDRIVDIERKRLH
ncbi:hypothetical protein AX17_004737 [Amanita inopinata Kibby_2008]|nr:hypothetical protein AX17_004737 [Amanita inopinata Kibby_2008]